MASGRMIKSANSRNDFGNHSNQVHLSARTIEEVSHEMDVERFYRSIIGEKYLNRYSNKSSRKLCSKTVQTEPNFSGIPSSYLILGQKLVDELYTGLGNMINTLYHTPNGNTELDPKCMKFFNYENGYWHSKLHPGVKIPAAVGVGREVNTEEFKKELYGLLEKAVKLKNALPYIIDIQQGEDSQPIVNITKACENKLSGVGKEVNPSRYEPCSNPAGSSYLLGKFDPPGCSSDPSGKFDAPVNLHETKGTADTKEKECVAETIGQDITGCDPELASGVSEYDSPLLESCCVQVPVPPRQTDAPPKKTYLQDGGSENIAGRGCASNGLVIIDGKLANLAKKSPPESKGHSNTLAGCSNGALKNVSVQAVKVGNASHQDTSGKTENDCNFNREKRGNEKGHHKAGKTVGSANDNKNFIKRNIMMASKTGQQAKRNRK